MTTAQPATAFTVYWLFQADPNRRLATDPEREQAAQSMLNVFQAHVGKNIVMRRFHARGRGKMSPIEKPFSQLTVVVKEVPAPAEESAEETA